MIPECTSWSKLRILSSLVQKQNNNNRTQGPRKILRREIHLLGVIFMIQSEGNELNSASLSSLTSPYPIIHEKYPGSLEKWKHFLSNHPRSSHNIHLYILTLEPERWLQQLCSCHSTSRRPQVQFPSPHGPLRTARVIPNTEPD